MPGNIYTSIHTLNSVNSSFKFTVTTECCVFKGSNYVNILAVREICSSILFHSSENGELRHDQIWWSELQHDTINQGANFSPQMLWKYSHENTSLWSLSSLFNSNYTFNSSELRANNVYKSLDESIGLGSFTANCLILSNFCHAL